MFFPVTGASRSVHSMGGLSILFTAACLVGAHAFPSGYAPTSYVSSSYIVAEPVAYAAKSLDYDPYPEYKFSYNVQDDVTGDSKSQHESRTGDVVHGSYSLDDADGTRRTVDYTSDPVHGFNAIVRKEPQHPKYVIPAVAYTVSEQPVAYAAVSPEHNHYNHRR